jgi:tetratricopeptide (TPR) repeat protein
MKKAVELHPEVAFMPLFLAEVYNEWKRPAEEETIYRRLISISKERRVLITAHLRLAKLLHQQNRFSEEEFVLWGFQRVYPEWANYELETFYDSLIKAYPNNTDWQYRYADFKYKHGSRFTATKEFEKLLAIDSTQAARAHVHALAGAYYLHEGKKTKMSETDSTWAGDMPKAIAHLRRAAALEPSLPSAKYDLARACTAIFEYDEALAVLRNLLDSNDLGFESRLLLADLEMRSGNTEAAEKLLQRAWDLQPEPVPHLNELSGKLKQLEGKPKEAMDFYLKELAFDDDEIVQNLAYGLARLYAQQNDKNNALKYLEAAVLERLECKHLMRYDPAWDALRSEIKFKELVKKLAD